jgi:MFS family permease
MGIGIGMAVPALRRIAILADPEHIGRNLGRLLAADVAGFACGPALAAILVGPFGIAAPFLASAAAGAVALPFVARIDVVETVDTAETGAPRFAFDLLRQRSYAGAVALGCGVFLMIGTFDALWSVALDDLATAEWIASLGISLFAVPLVVFGSFGGRLAQRVGPFRLGTVGLTAGSVFMFLYGLAPSGAAMFVIAMVHAIGDGFTVSSSGVAVGMVVDPARMAGAQGVLGGMQTLVAGITAVVAGVIYDHGGRTAAYTVCAALMVAVTVVGAALAGPDFHLRCDRPDALSPVSPPPAPEPTTARN